MAYFIMGGAGHESNAMRSYRIRDVIQRHNQCDYQILDQRSLFHRFLTKNSQYEISRKFEKCKTENEPFSSYSSAL